MIPRIPVLVGASLIGATLVGTLGCALPRSTGSPPAAGALSSAGAAPVAASSAAAVVPDRPVTELGRTVLPRADVIVLGKTTRVTAAANGAEVGRVAPSAWLRGVPREEGPPLTVLCAAHGVLPAAGRDAVFLLGSLAGSEDLELVEAATLDDADGQPRLAALRKNLEIESVTDPAARMEALRVYLRDALASPVRWTRWNAAREYAALAIDVPGTLTAADRPAIETAFDRATEKQLREVLQRVLDNCPGAHPRVAAQPASAPIDSSVVTELTARYLAKDASVPLRRQAVIDAAVRAGPKSSSLIALALADADAPVREAAAAAAGELRLAPLEPTIAAMLASDLSPVVRRTLVVAAGRLRSEASVPTLAVLGKAIGRMATDAAFALARIRSDSAMTELRRLRSGTADAERRGVIDFLLSDRFVEQERALGETQ